jgi:DNA-binding HxlR family transcriptional regulator
VSCTSDAESTPADRGPDRPFAQYDSETCSIARTLALVGDRWTLLVLRDLGNGVRRFDDLAEHLGVARNVLARRLTSLLEAGLITTRAYREPGARQRHEYRMTESGRDLMPILLAFMGWGDRHLAGPDGAPAVPVHDGCGAPVRVSVTCEAGHDLGERPRLRLGPGPGSRLRAAEPDAGAKGAEAKDAGAKGAVVKPAAV